MARFVFSENSTFMKARLAECLADRCCFTSRKDGVSRSGNALLNLFGKLGSDPVTSRIGTYLL